MNNDEQRARIQYDLSQQPRLLHYLPTNVLSLLQASLESHRYALNLKGDDTNTLLYGSSSPKSI